MGENDLFVQRLLEIVNEGKRETTYKLALLLALVEWVATNEDKTIVPTAKLADLVLDLYWRQVRPFVDLKGETVELSQGKKPPALIISAVAELRNSFPGDTRLQQVRAKSPALVKTAVEKIQTVLIQQPIPRLQRYDSKYIPFLYECSWKEKAPVSPLKKSGSDFVTLLPGVRGRLLTLGPLFRPFIEQVWIADVLSWSSLATEEDALRAHLFSSSRVQFPPKLRAKMAEAQNGKCFYCAKSLGADWAVDHFIPWSKHPSNAAENLVASCKKCNGSKSDKLVVPKLLEPWVERCLDSSLINELSSLWSEDSNTKTSLTVARNFYESLLPGSVIWGGVDIVETFTASHGSQFEAIFSQLP